MGESLLQLSGRGQFWVRNDQVGSLDGHVVLYGKKTEVEEDCENNSTENQHPHDEIHRPLEFLFDALFVLRNLGQLNPTIPPFDIFITNR